jgi:L-methionine (R)-S-oxide reductase
MSPILPGTSNFKRPTLLLGPFHGLPACQSIPSIPGKGVCADASALLPPRTVKVDNTEEYPGHIACDSASKSEIVVPIVLSRSKVASFVQAQESESFEWQGRGDQDNIIIGVLDIDCEALQGFDEEDVKGLEGIVQQIADACDW